MFKKMLITLGLLAATTLSGCVVYAPPRAVVYGPAPGAVVYAPGVVVPIVPVYGFYGGWGWHGGYGRWR
jgi:hypothetical protein